jgi:propionyl-CoA carboxylase alpha chain
MTRDITRVLVANRGEISARVTRTLHRLGIDSVAVFSEPDRGLPYVDEATSAVALGGTTSAESYLDVAKILDAALRTGADAVHPGYGFLSENAEFAEAVQEAGLVWIGPTPASMRAMALKVEAKRIAEAAGVPLVPGAELDPDADSESLLDAAARVGYPVLVKASAGGGGKGMRVVRDADELVDAVAGARREAQSSFGDATVFLERYVERARHVEVQVFGDEHGEVVHLFERECSVQRRHQKVVEESPSPGATPQTLDRMYAAAVSLAQAIGYVGAGTVEFLVSGEGDAQEFFFLEMNTRLQVEHPVTEMVTGLDLVEWQVRIARGEPLPLQQGDVERDGHAIEVRLYAEDPARGFLPSTGTVTRWELLGYGDERVDAGYDEGSVVSPHYDPMLAKVIAHAPDRAAAAASLATMLRQDAVGGVVTNVRTLVAILTSEAFLAGDTTTAFLDEHPEVLAPLPPESVVRQQLAALGSLLLDGDGERGSWGSRSPRGWRNVGGVPETLALRYAHGADDRVAVVAHEWRRDGSLLWVCADAGTDLVPPQTIDADPRFERLTGVRLEQDRDMSWYGAPGARLELDGVRTSVVIDVGDHLWMDGALDANDRPELSAMPRVVTVRCDGWATEFTVVDPWAGSGHDTGGSGPSTPVPGTVTHVAVSAGDVVVAGQALVVLEAMKMEHTIRADADGTVTEVLVRVGQSVDAHTVVAVVEAS